jgi:hypothetical protein
LLLMSALASGILSPSTYPSHHLEVGLQG